MKAETLHIRLANMAARSRFMTGLAIVTLIAAYLGLHIFVDSFDWTYKGYGFLIWAVFLVQFIFAWVVTGFFVPILKSQKGVHDISTVNDMYRIRAGRLIDSVAETTGYNKEVHRLIVNDTTPNAFAAGTGSSTCVALNSGLLNILDDDEVEGVIAHEFGHLKNNDIFITLFATSLVGAFIIIGRFIMNAGIYNPKSSKKNNSWVLIALGFAIMAFGYIFAPILTAFISRQRENLADLYASSYGYGEGLKKALAKLAAYKGKTKPIVENAASLYINQPVTDFIGSIFSTHPPIATRISNIDNFMSSDEGRIPDTLESILKSFITWVVVPATGAIVMAFSGKFTDLSGIFGIPYVYLASVMWLLAVSTLVGSVSTNYSKSISNWILIAAGFVYLLAFWASGMVAVNLGSELGGIFATVVATIMFWAWAVKPATAMLGQYFGIMSLASDFTNYASYIYAVSILVTLGLRFF